MTTTIDRSPTAAKIAAASAAPMPQEYDQADWSLIPSYMGGGLRRYIENGITPGSFLLCVLANDLRGAVDCADADNLHRLPDYVRFLYTFAPLECWGGPEEVKRWIDHHGLGREKVYRDGAKQ